MILELATFHLDSVKLAEKLGIKRLELCENYSQGGVTPSVEFFKKAKAIYSGKIFVMIRPRSGDFIFSDEEFEVMLNSVREYKQLDVDGFVSGFLRKDHSIHQNQLAKFAEACFPNPFTFHRAFDLIPDWKFAMDLLINLGCKRILSSGNANTAIEGLTRLKEMKAYANEKLIILPGGGIRSSNIIELMHELHPTEIHTAAIVNFSDRKEVADEGELRGVMKLMSE